MSENDFKKTYNGFTKFVLWGNISGYSYISNFGSYITIK